MKTCDQLQTMAVTYAEICQGESPWVALGNFMNDWFDYARERREQLVSDPLELPDPLTPELQRWAAFCAASVEWFCQQYAVVCPQWAYAPVYALEEPWIYYPLARSQDPEQQKELRERLVQQTPEPFARRNIYCGERMFHNKYEYAEKYARLRSA
ncbi:MAG TPA: hypothetical protein VFV38_12655 [Ktedonobacteraceae bacterium]|nr:hypothetical protein [Ktedonobacteraceae bacterium]